MLIRKSLQYTLFAGALFFSLLTFAGSHHNKANIKKAYENWCSAIGTAKGNAADIVKYYAPDATLIPTLSSKILHNTNGGLDDYFTKLTSLKDIQCIPDSSSIKIHENIATNSGFYTFSYDDNGKPKKIKARFSFIYKKIGKEWLIKNHHSSKTP